MNDLTGFGAIQPRIGDFSRLQALLHLSPNQSVDNSVNNQPKHPLFRAYHELGIPLKNRIVMAPMTRSRAFDHLPNELMAEYYRQRASAGLIISESIAPSPDGLGYPRVPGIFNEAQTEGWQMVTEAVHKEGGKIIAQLNHGGRLGSALNLPDGARIVGPSAISARVNVWSDIHGMVVSDVPHPLSKQEIRTVIREFIISANNAIAAGFDGVEIHAANGYLLEQFLNPYANQRSDEYGGSIENRSRIVVELTEAVAGAVGKEKLGIRFSPFNTLGSLPHYDQIGETYAYLAEQMERIEIQFVHVVDAVARLDQQGDHLRLAMNACIASIRRKFEGVVILNGCFDKQRAQEAIDRGLADLVSFGTAFISNPDLPLRLENNLPLAEADRATFYAPTENGYIDYPNYKNEHAQQAD